MTSTIRTRRTRPGIGAATRRPRAGLAAACTLTTLAVVLAGCTSSSGGAKASTTTSPSSPSGSGSGSSPTTIVNQPTARKAVAQSSCKATSSGWTAQGTVANPNAKQTTYTIVISFTTKQSTVLARGTTKVAVKGGATKSWTVSANFAKTKGVVCVLRGVAAS